MTDKTPPRPTSSRPRPNSGDDLRNRPRPSSPSLTGDEVELESETQHPTTPDDPDSRDEVKDDVNTPHTTWLITDRTRPFWKAARNLLADHNWHHRDQLYALGKQHDLAERTVANLLPRASKRRWIERSREHVRIRDKQALDAALKPLDDQP